MNKNLYLHYTYLFNGTFSYRLFWSPLLLMLIEPVQSPTLSTTTSLQPAVQEVLSFHFVDEVLTLITHSILFSIWEVWFKN